jgi:hypothetical protein
MSLPEEATRTSTPMSDFYDLSCEVVERPDPVKMYNEEGDFWRRDTPELQEGFVTRGGMFAHQYRWWELTNFVKILVGGYGSGKTLSLCKRAIGSALQNAPYIIAVVSPSFPIARQTTIASIFELLAGKRTLFGRSFWWTYNQTTHHFQIRFRGKTGNIIVYSGDKPLSLRGPNLAAAYIDEPFIQDEEVYTQMVARVRHPNAVLREIGMSGTPEQLNWGYDLCEGELGEDQDVGYVQASTKDNLALDPDYVSRLTGALTNKAVAAYVDGEFIELTEGLVYYGFSRMTNVDQTGDLDKIPEGAELGVGMDFNVNPMAGMVFWKLGNRLHFFDELELPNADTEYMCMILKERYWEKGLRKVYPDATGTQRRSSAPGGKTDFHYIKQAGFRVLAHRENPKRRDRYNTVNGRLAPKEGKPYITVSKKCKKLRKYLSVYSYELINKQEHMSHLLDAFGYPICYLLPIVRGTTKQLKLVGG